MKFRSVALALLFAAGPTASADLLACGDKFLVMGRGTRFQRAGAPRTPGAILVYASPASALPLALPDVPIDAALRKAGHRSTVVSTGEELDRALRAGGWDLVVVDLAESELVSSRLQGDTAPALLRVVHNATRTEFRQARKQYKSLVKSPTRNQAFLDEVDEALSRRQRPAARPTGKTTT